MIRLLSCPKGYSLDQDKAVSPGQTVALVRERLQKLPLSILSETRRIDTGRLDIPVYLSVCGSDARDLLPSRKQMGKGASPEQAEASAMMELVERYSFFSFWRRLPRAVHATWSEAEQLFGNTLISLEEICKACHDCLRHEDAKRVMNLRSWLFVPTTRIADGHICHIPLDLFKQLGEFNGSSAGNTDVESVLQGACELVERHCCHLATREQQVLPTIDCSPGAIDDPVLADLLDKFQRNGIVLLLKDMTMGLPVPTVAAMAFDPASFPSRSEIVFTAGTAASPVKAAVRALTEVAQLAGDFGTASCYEASGLPKYTQLDQCAWLRKGPVVPLHSLPSIESNDILTELKNLADSLRDRGFNLYSVATTDPDISIPAHYSIIPGFGFRERDSNSSLGLFAGRMISETSDGPEADAALRVLEEVYPGAHFLPFFKGMLALRAADHQAALLFFAEAEPVQPDDEAKGLAAFYHAYVLTLDEEWAKALPCLDRAVRLSPDMKEYLNLRGVCLFKLQRYAEAAEDFMEIITRLDKGSATDLQNLGLCHKLLGNNEAARRFLGAALTLDPGLKKAGEHLRELQSES